MISSPADSSRALFCSYQAHPDIRKGLKALNESGVGTNLPLKHRISETVQDRTKVAIDH